MEEDQCADEEFKEFHCEDGCAANIEGRLKVIIVTSVRVILFTIW